MQGNRYEGEWRNDLMYGHGIFTGADGHRYGGEFKDGNLHGKGIYQHKDGRCFEGHFENNKRNGTGLQRYADGSEYDGAWKDDLRDGQGTLSQGKGLVEGYTGAWLAGKHHGEGSLQLQDGMRFVGKFEAGRPLPGGVFSWSDGVSTTFALESRFELFLGPRSDPAGWHVALVKLMQHWKKTRGSAPAGGDDPDEETFGFGQTGGARAEEEEPLASDEEWEEVDLDEHGRPIESTARPVES